MKFALLINSQTTKIANSYILNIAEREKFLVINMKMPTTVYIFIFISRVNFMLS